MASDGASINSAQGDSPTDWKQDWPRRHHLLIAAAQKRLDLVELIIKAGVDPNQIDEVGETILHDAVRLERMALSTVAMLLPFVTQREIRNKRREDRCRNCGGRRKTRDSSINFE
jgi:hypothetical protein